MTLSETEQKFLHDHHQGRLATVGPSGAPQVKPVGFTYDADLGTVDISGFNMAQSAKFHNIKSNPKVAFVVDDILFEAMEGVRFLEVRGEAEAVTVPAPADSHLAPQIIRIHPRRVVSFNIDPDNPGFQARDVQAANDRPEVA